MSIKTIYKSDVRVVLHNTENDFKAVLWRRTGEWVIRHQGIKGQGSISMMPALRGKPKCGVQLKL